MSAADDNGIRVIAACTCGSGWRANGRDRLRELVEAHLIKEFKVTGFKHVVSAGLVDDVARLPVPEVEWSDR